MSALQGALDSGGTLLRPEPGLARGRWEAPTWLFYALLAAAVVVGLVWATTALRGRRTG